MPTCTKPVFYIVVDCCDSFCMSRNEAREIDHGVTKTGKWAYLTGCLLTFIPFQEFDSCRTGLSSGLGKR